MATEINSIPSWSIFLLLSITFNPNLNVAHAAGYDSSCTCSSVSSNVCMQYSCTITQKQDACFAGKSLVRIENGQMKQLADIQIDERILVNENRTFEPLLTFIHATHEGMFDFLSMKIRSSTSDLTSTLLVSPNHLLFDYDSKQARFASYFRVGHRVQYIDKDHIVPGEIVDIQLTREVGYYAPMTASGKVIIDHVVASNYATVSNHDLAHRTMTIYRWWLELMGGRTTWGSEIPSTLQFLLDMTSTMQNTVATLFLNNELHDGTFQVSALV